MPKDAWASTRRRDAVRRAKSGRSWAKSSTKTKSKAKKRKKAAKAAAKRDRIRSEMDRDRNYQAKKLGRAPTFHIPAGTVAAILKPGHTEWVEGYVTKKSLTLATRRVVDGYAIYRHRGYQLCVPLPGTQAE